MTGFYERAADADAIADAAPFLYWLTHGTRFPPGRIRNGSGSFPRQ
jgi:hypothetical protein